MNERLVRIAGTGAYLPGEPVKFHDIEKVLGEIEDVGDDFKKWYKRTRNVMYQILGMENYFYAVDRETGACNETCAGMAAKASRQALEMAGLEPNDVELLIYGSSSMDRFVCPPTSVFVQQELGIEECAEMSIHSNCTATYKAMQVAHDLIRVGRYKNALICSTNLVSSALKASFFNQAKIQKNNAILRWFLSDGGGAMVLKAEEEPVPGLYFYDTYLESVGCHYPPHMYNQMGSSSNGPLKDYELGLHHIVQDFREVSQLGPKLSIKAFGKFLDQLKVRMGEEEFRRRMRATTHVLANVPTKHMIDLAIDEIMPMVAGLHDAPSIDLYYSTTDKMGYTGPVAILLTLDRLARKEKLADGATILSFVTESSKWMNAGFMLENRA